MPSPTRSITSATGSQRRIVNISTPIPMTRSTGLHSHSPRRSPRTPSSSRRQRASAMTRSATGSPALHMRRTRHIPRAIPMTTTTGSRASQDRYPATPIPMSLLSNTTRSARGLRRMYPPTRTACRPLTIKSMSMIKRILSLRY